jgi:hypothetical protein
MTQPITISISHELGAAEAKRRIANGFGRMVQQLPGGALMQMQERWEGDRMFFEARALGQSVSGYADVGPAAVTLVVTLPPLLAGLAEKLRGKLAQTGQLLLKKG